MSKGMTMLLIALAAGAGIFVGRFSAKSGEPSVDIDALPAPSATGAESAPALRETPALAGKGDPAGDAFRDALAKLPTPEIPKGTGSISGSVLTADGQPIPGVLVTATPQESGRKWTSTDEMDPADAVRQYAESLAWMKAAGRSATSGSDGKYVVDGLADVALWVRAKRDGWRLSNHAPIRPGSTVNFVGTPTATVTLDVRLPNGAPAPSASIEWRNSSGGSGTVWKPDGSPTTMDPGRWKVTARSGDEGLLTSDPVDVMIEVGKPSTVRLDLKDHPAIRVRIQWPEGETFPTPAIRYAELGPDDKPDLSLLASSSRRDRMQSYSYGTAPLLRDVTPGRYLVGVARFDGDPAVVLETVVVAESVAEVTVTMPPTERASYVLARAVDADGKPADAQMQLAMRSATRSMSGVASSLKRSEGVWWLFPHKQQSGDAPAGAKFWVIATSPNLGTATSEYTPGAAPEATVRFLPPGRVDVVCEGLVGSRLLQKVTAAVVPADEARRQGRSGERFSREGTVTITPVQPGPADVVLAYSIDDWGGSTIVRVPLVVASGSQRVPVTLPRLHSVTFRLKAGGGVYLRRDDDPSWARNAQATGDTVVIEALPDGTYKVQGTDRNPVSFTLPGTAEVDLR